jgi:gamma-glutamyl hydrolase
MPKVQNSYRLFAAITVLISLLLAIVPAETKKTST